MAKRILALVIIMSPLWAHHRQQRINDIVSKMVSLVDTSRFNIAPSQNQNEHLAQEVILRSFDYATYGKQLRYHLSKLPTAQLDRISVFIHSNTFTALEMSYQERYLVYETKITQTRHRLISKLTRTYFNQEYQSASVASYIKLSHILFEHGLRPRLSTHEFRQTIANFHFRYHNMRHLTRALTNTQLKKYTWFASSKAGRAFARVIRQSQIAAIKNPRLSDDFFNDEKYDGVFGHPGMAPSGDEPSLW